MLDNSTLISWALGAIEFFGGLVLGVYFKIWIEYYVGAGPKQHRFKTLRGYYTATYVQGQRTDKIALFLETKGKNKLSGKAQVKYQKSDNSYPLTVETMRIEGHFRFDCLLCLEYQNIDVASKQAGVILLDYKSTKELVGHFVSYWDPIPEDRKPRTGELTLTRCTKQEAIEFLK